MFNKRFVLLWTSGLALLAASTLVLAQRGSSRKMSREEFERRVKREGDGYFARYDRNKDGRLDTSEVSARLRSQVKRYDRNRDGKISRSEYAPYIRAFLEDRYRMKSRPNSSSPKSSDASTDLSVLDKRPIVYRNGNIPDGLPEWFKQLDNKEKGGDGDSQVGLYEWRKAKKNLAEFDEYDRNKDGFLTVAEMRYFHEYVTKADFTSLAKTLSPWQMDSKLSQSWKVQEGVIHYVGRGGKNLRTRKKYGNFELWMDWKIDRGGDSGVYLRGQPQVQIWNQREGSGGLYNNKRGSPGQRPLVFADKPAGQWNTFHIKMVGDRVTVKLNGKVVVDNAQMMDGRVPKTGFLEFQARDKPLWFRNIYIKELPDS